MKLTVMAIAAIVIWQALLLEETYRVSSYTDQQFVISHRGEMLDRPEQTMVAYEYALENDARIVECDARRTADGVFVAMHDATWDRTTNGTGSVALTDWQGYGEWLDAGSHYSFEYKDERVPTIQGLLSWAHKNAVLLWVDVYFSGEFDGEFMELIEDERMGDRVVVQFIIETRDFHRADAYEGIHASYRVAIPFLDLVLTGIELCEDDEVAYLTIPWEMGYDEVYSGARDHGVNIILYAYNQYKSDSEYLAEFQAGAWGCFTDSSTQAKYLQAIIDGW